jgi:hypothetical protein
MAAPIAADERGRPRAQLGCLGGTLKDMVGLDEPQQWPDEGAALAAELVGLPLLDAIRRAEEKDFQVRRLAEGDVVTLEMNWNRVNLTPAPDGTVLRAYRG